MEELSELLRIPSISAPIPSARTTSGALPSGSPNRCGEWAARRRSLSRPRRSARRRRVRASAAATRRPSSATGISTCSRPGRPTSGDRSVRARGAGRLAPCARSGRRQGPARALLKATEGWLPPALPVNVRFVCDGEEETGGHQVVEFIASDERGADSAVIFDSAMLRPGAPVFHVATRGMICSTSVRTGERDLHSGVFGGAALSSTDALMQTLRAVLPGRTGSCPPAPRGHGRTAGGFADGASSLLVGTARGGWSTPFGPEGCRRVLFARGLSRP